MSKTAVSPRIQTYQRQWPIAFVSTLVIGTAPNMANLLISQQPVYVTAQLKEPSIFLKDEGVHRL
jgi:hypothetical protein